VLGPIQKLAHGAILAWPAAAATTSGWRDGW